MEMDLPRTVQVDERYQAPEEDLHTCGRCASRLVEPVTVRRFDEQWWHVTRRCPECEWSAADLVREHAVARLSDELDAGRATLTALLHEIERSEMERDVERFARCLALGHVLPEDF